MTAADTLAAALEREHHEIDTGIEAFLNTEEKGSDRVEPLRQAIAALRRHIYLEEVFLFPPLKDGGLFAPIFVMLREHGEIWDTMAAIDAQLGNDAGAGPDEASCRELLAQLEQHNLKEEAVIYPEADAGSSADASTELRAFLTAGRMPPGWVCEQAGT